VAALNPSGVLALQRRAGNRAISAMLANRQMAHGQRPTANPVAVQRQNFTATHGAGFAPLLDDEGGFVGADMIALEQTTRSAIAQEQKIKESKVFDGAVRARMLEAYIADAEAKRQASQDLAQQTDAQASVLGVFLAPEWYFKKVPPYTVEEREKIVRLIEKISSNYPSMLIVPGTIVWRKAGTGPHGPFRKYAEMGNMAPVVFRGRCVHRIDKKALAGDTGGYLRKGEDKGKLDTILTDPKAPKATREYQRHSAKVDPNQDSSFFQIENVKFSLEICGDHSSGRRAMRQLMSNPPFPNGDKADVQLLVAHGAGFLASQGSVLRAGGVAYSVDARPPEANDLGPKSEAQLNFGMATAATATGGSQKRLEGGTLEKLVNQTDRKKYYRKKPKQDLGVWNL
jgi:hypothetical protein